MHRATTSLLVLAALLVYMGLLLVPSGSNAVQVSVTEESHLHASNAATRVTSTDEDEDEDEDLAAEGDAEEALQAPSTTTARNNGKKKSKSKVKHFFKQGHGSHTIVVHNNNDVRGYDPSAFQAAAVNATASVAQLLKAEDNSPANLIAQATVAELANLQQEQKQLEQELKAEKGDFSLQQQNSNPGAVAGLSDSGVAPTVRNDIPKRFGQILLRKPWYNYGGDYEIAHWNVEDGICYLSGMVRGNGGLVGTLPEECRPIQGRLVFPVIKGGEPARVDVLNDGRIYHVAGGKNGWMSLTGISFALNISPNLKLINGWQSYGGAYRESNIYVLNNTLCMISGMVRGGRWGNFGVLPQECTPTQRLIFSANNHQAVTRIDVLPMESGGYFARAGGFALHGWANFDGMSWTQTGGLDIPPNNPWQNFGGAYQPLRFERVGPVCIVSGLVKSTDWSPHIVRLPAECRPKKRLVFGCNVMMSSARVDVLPDGRIFYMNGKLQWPWLSLSGIKFIVDTDLVIPSQDVNKNPEIGKTLPK